MKRLLNFLTGVVAVAAITLSTCLSTIACDSVNNDPIANYKIADSTYIADAISAIVNPSFNSVNDVVTFRKNLQHEFAVDEMFRNIPEDVLGYVTNVCLKYGSNVTKNDIVTEYLTNKAVYDGLSSIPIQDLQSLSSLTSPQIETSSDTAAVFAPPIEITYRWELDTVDGKPMRILVKEERAYEN